MKPIPLRFFLLLIVFPIHGWTVEQAGITPVATLTPLPITKLKSKFHKRKVPPLPPGAKTFVPKEAFITQVEWMDLRGKGNKDLMVCYQDPQREGILGDISRFISVAEILGRDKKNFVLLWREEFKGQGVNASYEPYPLNPYQSLPVLLINHGAGASVGSALEILHWNGKTFQIIGGSWNWGYGFKDLGENGGKELVCKNRYGPDWIYVYKKGHFVKKEKK